MTDIPSDNTSPESKNRRDFLTLLTASTVTVGGVALVWPFLNSLSPPAKNVATQRFIDVDISPLAEGQQISVVWQNKPIFIIKRSSEALKKLQDPDLLILLRDPESKEHQQPAYATNWHRSIKPEFGVFIGICTHLGCVPILTAGNILGKNYHCACHGSTFDLSGRVYQSVPAPYNLPVPPYDFIKPNIIRIGKNPDGHSFGLEDITQL